MSMSGIWSAFQNDLNDFVSTIKEDTTKVALAVAKESDDNEVDIQAALARQELDLCRSHATYANPPSQRKQFQTFMEKFTLDKKDIQSKVSILVDEEADICRYYVELVPSKITPEMFWGRYFFKLMVISISKVDDNEDDEEDLSWDEEDISVNSGNGNSNDTSKSSITADKARISKLEEANGMLNKHVRLLTGRVAELEQQLKDKVSMSTSASASTSTIVVSHGDNVDNTPPTPISPQKDKKDDDISLPSSPVPVPELVTVESDSNSPVIVKELRELDLDADDEEEEGWD